LCCRRWAAAVYTNPVPVFIRATMLGQYYLAVSRLAPAALEEDAKKDNKQCGQRAMP
jgi:hypothetical protein